MKKLAFLPLVALVPLLAGSVATASQSQGSPNMQVTLKITQGVTHRSPRPPAGDTNDVFSVLLTMFAIKPEFGREAESRVGSMTFSYVMHGVCGTKVGEGCKGTVDVETRSQLPGGTIMAAAKGIPIRAPFIVNVSRGTGRYAGAKGRIVIAPEGQARNIFEIRLPS
jgi:hypothetical protein